MNKEEIQKMKDSVDKIGRKSIDSEMAPISNSDPFLNQEEMIQKLRKDFSSANDFDLLAQRVSKMESYFTDLISKVRTYTSNKNKYSFQGRRDHC